MIDKTESTAKTEVVTFEQATSLTGNKAVAFFSEEKNISPLVEQVKKEALSLVPDLTTKKGREAIGSNALKVSKSRKMIEELIDQSVSSLDAKVNKAKEVKKKVSSDLKEVRDAVLAPRNQWQKEQDEIEQKRVDAIKEKIERISKIGLFTEDETVEQLSQKIDALENIDVSDSFEEFTADAAKAIGDAISALNARIHVVIEKIKHEEQQAQLLAEQKKTRIQERLSNLVQIPLSMMGMHSNDIKAKLDSLKRFSVIESEFEDRTEEAKASLFKVVFQLELLLNQAKQLEEVERAANAVELNKQLPENSSVKYDEVVHSSDCKGCPDCHGINCEITNNACKEELESSSERSQAMRNDGTPSLITKSSHPELFEFFKSNCDFDTSTTPKHGKGYVNPEVEYEGNTYKYSEDLVWDYSYGIDEWYKGAWVLVDASNSADVNTSTSQLQKNISATDAKSTHVPLHVDFIDWSRKYSIDSDAFAELESILKKHII